MEKQEFRDYIIGDVLAGIEGVSHKGLFGGYGFYLDEIIFGAYMDDDQGTAGFFLKGDEKFGQEIIAEGGKQFVYIGHKTRGPTAMPYYHVPDEILEDREKITGWVYQAWNISKQSKKK